MSAEWMVANQSLNQWLEQGRSMEAFEAFYDEQVEMQENEEPPRIGKALNREICLAFAKQYPDLTLKIGAVGYGNEVSFQEVVFHYTDEYNESIHYTEVAIRHWQNNRVVKEKFYYALEDWSDNDEWMAEESEEEKD